MAKKSKRIFEKYPKTTMVLLVVMLTWIMDLTAGIFYIPATDHDFRVYHPYFHHGLLPNQAQTTHWGPIDYPIYTNDMGFRDSIVREIPLQSGKHRILFMGDSHAEGVGVSFAESFTGQLLSRIDTTQIEILNGAAVSYSPKLYYYKTRYLIEEVGLDFDELYVFIDISDIQNEYAYEQFHPSTAVAREVLPYLDKKLKNLSFLYYAVTSIYLERQREKFYKQVSKEQIAHNNTVDLYRTFFSHFDNDVLLHNPQFHTTISEWYSDENLYRRWGSKGAELMTLYMKKLVNLCRQHGISMTVTVHPWRTHVMKGEIEDRHTLHWRNFAKENSIGFISFYPLFIDEKPPEEVIQTCYIPYDNHWTAAGHQLVADKLFSFIGAQRGMVTEDRYHYHQGIIWQEKQKFDSAIFHFSHAIQINPTQASYFYQRGKVYLGKSNFQRAAEDFKQALMLDSTHQKAKLSSKLVQAYQSAHRYTHLLQDHETDHLYVQRGKALLQLGRHKSAYEDFERARELNPGNKESYYYIGYMKHHLVKSPREGIPYFNKAIALDSGYLDAYQQRAAAFMSLGAKDKAMKDMDQVHRLSGMVDDE